MRYLLMLLIMLNGLLAPRAQGQEAGIAVIMGADAAQGKLNRGELALIFKRKRRFWDDGLRIQALNLPANSPLRRAFTQQLYNRTPEELDDYWRDQYFQGTLPPYVLVSEEAVIRMVAATPGAIGYISACLTDHRVTVVLRLDDGFACAH